MTESTARFVAETEMQVEQLPPGEGHKFHRHPEMEEIIYVVDGRAEQWVEQDKQMLTAGQIAHIPTNLVHATFNAGEESLVLGTDMTEARIRATDLSSHRILAFATHALVAGEIKGAAEAALVFTPPIEPSPLDDGLLTASEIARDLDLDADLVVLSACNTAAGNSPGAEGLSGLAKAFFYAGSRSLLVSHWPVASQAAVQLTTGMFKELKSDPSLGRAESLRRSKVAMIEDRSRSYFAHPLFWAPFVLVGEGRASLPKPQMN